MSKSDIPHVWRKRYWLEYETDQDDQHACVMSHFARHNISSFWSKQQMSRENLMYLRGNVADQATGRGRDAIDHYLHYYEDAEETYKDKMFQFYL